MNESYYRPKTGHLIAFILALSLLGVILKVVIPNLVRPVVTTGHPCILNLRIIDEATRQFALENNLTNGTLVNFPNDLTPYISSNDLASLKCPSGGTYHVGPVGTTPTCSLGTTVTPAHVLPHE